MLAGKRGRTRGEQEGPQQQTQSPAAGNPDPEQDTASADPPHLLPSPTRPLPLPALHHSTPSGCCFPMHNKCKISAGCGWLTSSVVVHRTLGEHGVVLELGLAQGGAVGGNDHQLGCEAKRQGGSGGGDKRERGMRLCSLASLRTVGASAQQFGGAFAAASLGAARVGWFRGAHPCQRGGS